MAGILYSLGLNHVALEEFDGAKPCLQRSADIYNETLGQKHVGTVNPQIGLGDATRLAGNLEEARQILETTLETQESTISSNQGNEYEQTIAVLPPCSYTSGP